MNRLRFTRAVAGAGLILALAGSLWYFLEARRTRARVDPERARREGRPIPVRTARVEQVDLEEVIGATALTVPANSATIQVGYSNGFLQSDVVIKAVHVQEGDRVSPGQVLFEVDDKAFRALVRQRRAALNSAEAELALVEKKIPFNRGISDLELKSARAEVEYRSAAVEVLKEMYRLLCAINRPAKAASDFSVFDKRLQLAEAEYYRVTVNARVRAREASLATVEQLNAQQLAQARGAVESARANLAIAERDVDRCRIKSPIAGFVTKYDVVPGQEVQITGNPLPLTRVVQLDPIHVRLDFPQDRIDDLTVGQEADVVLDGFPQETFRGTVLRIAPEVNPQLRVLPVVVEVANPANRIKAGLSGFARLHVRKTAPVVPGTAVSQSGAKAVVFRVEGGRARARVVQTGEAVAGGGLVVRGGLAAGDEVVIFHNFYGRAANLGTGQGYLRDNDPVDVDWRRWAGRE
jgi:HlyD family secretion protein